MVGWISAVWGCVSEGTVYNTLKEGGTEKMGGKTKVLKRGQAG